MDEYNAQNDNTYYKSNKDKNKLMHKGYVCRINRSVDQTVCSLCEQSLYHCNGRITMKNGIITKRNPHNYVPDISIGKAQECVSVMKDDAKDARDSISVVVVVNGDDEDGDDGERLVLRIRRQLRWQNPKFPPRLWSVYERVLNDEPRTTNMLEGWHRRFSSIVAKHHPNIYDFIGCLRSEQFRTETQVNKLVEQNQKL